jgi:hypothetical protein
MQPDFENALLVALHVELFITGKVCGVLHADLQVDGLPTSQAAGRYSASRLGNYGTC